MLKGLLVLLTFAGAAVCGYVLGAIGTRFNEAHCYHGVIAAVREHAEDAIKLGPTALPQFQRFMDSLPLVGYETNCDEVHKVLREQAPR
jgi:hypothetical protein